MGPNVWKLIGTGAAMLAGMVANKIVNSGWQKATGKEAPSDPTNPDVDWKEALAFAAFGQRDLQPIALRVRLLGLHSQLYESETLNAEQALSVAAPFGTGTLRMDNSAPRAHPVDRAGLDGLLRA